MSIEENKRVVRELVKEVWNKHQPKKVGEFFAGELVDEIGEHARQFLGAFPDLQVKIEDLVAEGDRVFVRLLATGTNSGPFAGQHATGKYITFRSFRVYRLVNGKVVDTWAMQDRMGLMEQLGFIQSAGGVNWGSDEAVNSDKG